MATRFLIGGGGLGIGGAMCDVRIGETAWSRNRSFGPDSGMRELGNKRGHQYMRVSDQVPLISKFGSVRFVFTEMRLDTASIIY